MADNLLACIQQVKHKYRRCNALQDLHSQPESTPNEMKTKIRAMGFAMAMVAEENKEVTKIQQNLVPVLEDKDKMLAQKEVEVKKYREQLADALSKNEELSNYCRQLAHQYTVLLGSAKDNEQVAIQRQASGLSKLKMMQNQVDFLRQNILKKNNIENCVLKGTKRAKSKKWTRSKSEKSLKVLRPNSSTINQGRKSLVHKLF